MELPKADNEKKACPCMNFWHLLTVRQRHWLSDGGLPCDVSVLNADSAQALTATQVLMTIASGHTSADTGSTAVLPAGRGCQHWSMLSAAWHLQVMACTHVLHAAHCCQQLVRTCKMLLCRLKAVLLACRPGDDGPGWGCPWLEVYGPLWPPGRCPGRLLVSSTAVLAQPYRLPPPKPIASQWHCLSCSS